MGLALQRGAKVGAPGSVNMRRKIAFSCLLQAEERNFLPHIHGTRSADFSPPLYITCRNCCIQNARARLAQTIKNRDEAIAETEMRIADLG